jgi:sarcosine oxidase
MLGARDGSLVAGARRSAELHRLRFEEIDAGEIRRRFPALRPEAGTVAILEPRAGALNPERAIEAMLALAQSKGAELRTGVSVESWRAAESAVQLHTTAGTIEATHAVLAAGPWLDQLIGPLFPLQVERQVMFWFSPTTTTDLLGPDRLPVFIWEWEPERYFYGFPDLGEGLKVARHHEGMLTTPADVDRQVSAAEIEDVHRCLRRYLPLAAGTFKAAAVCLYSNTPDRHFVIGPHPASPRITLLSPCSGHGFKFASAIGEIGADLATTGRSRFDLSPFSPLRFSKP